MEQGCGNIKESDPVHIGLVFKSVGRIGLDRLPDGACSSIHSVKVITNMSLISLGTELSQLYDQTGSVKRMQYPYRPRGYCVGSLVKVQGSQKTRLRVLLRGNHASVNITQPNRVLVVPLPTGLSDTDALLCTQAIPGAFAIARANLQNDAKVCVIGLGTIGHLLVRLLSLTKVKHICGIDRHSFRQQAIHDISSVTTTPSMDKLDNNQFDCVFVVTPAPSAISQALRVVVNGGKVVQVAAPCKMPTLDLANLLFRKNVTMIGAHEVGVNHGLSKYENKRKLLAELIDLIVDERLNLSKISTKVFKKSDADKAYNILRMGKDRYHTAFFNWH